MGADRSSMNPNEICSLFFSPPETYKILVRIKVTKSSQYGPASFPLIFPNCLQICKQSGHRSVVCSIKSMRLSFKRSIDVLDLIIRVHCPLGRCLPFHEGPAIIYSTSSTQEQFQMQLFWPCACWMSPGWFKRSEVGLSATYSSANFMIMRAVCVYNSTKIFLDWWNFQMTKCSASMDKFDAQNQVAKQLQS